MGFTLRGVAVSLGIAHNTAANYSLGTRTDIEGADKKEVIVPKVVLLACSAVEKGLTPIK